MMRFFLTITLPLLLSAGTIAVKTKAPQNRNAVFQYRVPKGYDKNRREMYRVLVIFGGRNTGSKVEEFLWGGLALIQRGKLPMRIAVSGIAKSGAPIVFSCFDDKNFFHKK